MVVRTVRRDTVGPGMESLTPCQVNRTRVAVRTVRLEGTQLDIAWNDPQTVKPTGSKWQ